MIARLIRCWLNPSLPAHKLTHPSRGEGTKKATHMGGFSVLISLKPSPFRGGLVGALRGNHVFFSSQVTFCINSGHTACTGSSNCLAVNVILGIAAAKHAFHIGFC